MCVANMPGNSVYLFSLYWNPNADDGIFDCLLASVAARQENNKKTSFVVIGDFNVYNREWQNSVFQTD